MRQRLKVWFARATLAALVLAPLGLTTLIKEHHTHHYWPYGRLHTFFQAILVITSYVVVITPATIVVVIAGVAVVSTLGWLCCVAGRQPHKPLLRWWSGDSRDKYVRYEDPTPLVRGRIGTK